jgi:ABC-2 type transport system ATP-binding protein
MIEVDHLSKSYGPSVALQEISLRVEAGEFLGLLGPCGAGKTTMLRLLAGRIPASSGRLTVAGYDVRDHPLEVRKRVGYLPAHTPLYNEMTVRDYLRFVAEVKGLDYYSQLSHVVALMEACDIRAVERRRIQSLSRGYRQRVGIAQALLNNPPVLVFDEPTMDLPPPDVAAIRHLLNEVRQQHTVVLGTRIIPEMIQLCDRVALIHAGQLLALDTPTGLLERVSQRQRLYLEIQGPAEAVTTLLRGLTYVLSVEPEPTASSEVCGYTISTTHANNLRAHLAPAIVQRGWLLHELRSMHSNLEEVFTQLVTEAD